MPRLPRAPLAGETRGGDRAARAGGAVKPIGLGRRGIGPPCVESVGPESDRVDIVSRVRSHPQTGRRLARPSASPGLRGRTGRDGLSPPPGMADRSASFPVGKARPGSGGAPGNPGRLCGGEDPRFGSIRVRRGGGGVPEAPNPDPGRRALAGPVWNSAGPVSVRCDRGRGGDIPISTDHPHHRCMAGWGEVRKCRLVSEYLRYYILYQSPCVAKSVTILLKGTTHGPP